MRLDAWLAQSNLTKRQFARLIRVGYPAVTRYLTGERRPNLDVARRIIEKTGGAVTLKDLIRGVE